MTQVTITLNSQANLLGVFLHHPGNAHPEPLPGVAHTVIRDLPDGAYNVAVSGTGIQPDTPVEITFATKTSSQSVSGRVKADGTIAIFEQFDLNDGVVS
jgi:hypothetical protein